MRRSQLILLWTFGLSLLLLTPQPVYADNCRTLSDCYETAQAASAAAVAIGLLAVFLSIGLDFVPVVGTIKGLYEAITGRDAVTGEELAWWERILGIIPLAGPSIKATVHGIRATRRSGSVRHMFEEPPNKIEVARVQNNKDLPVNELDKRFEDKALATSIAYTYSKIAHIPGADRLLQGVMQPVQARHTIRGSLSEVGYTASLLEEGYDIERVADVINGRMAADILIKNGPAIDVKDYNWASTMYQTQGGLNVVTKRLTAQVDRFHKLYPGRPIEYAFTDLKNAPREVVETLENLQVKVREVTWLGPEVKDVPTQLIDRQEYLDVTKVVGSGQVKK